MKTFNYWKLGLWSVVLASAGAVFWWLALHSGLRLLARHANESPP